MSIIAVMLFAIYAVIGGVSTVFLTVSLPAIIIWKVYRKVKFNKALTA